MPAALLPLQGRCRAISGPVFCVIRPACSFDCNPQPCQSRTRSACPALSQQSPFWSPHSGPGLERPQQDGSLATSDPGPPPGKKLPALPQSQGRGAAHPDGDRARPRLPSCSRAGLWGGRILCSRWSVWPQERNEGVAGLGWEVPAHLLEESPGGDSLRLPPLRQTRALTPQAALVFGSWERLPCTRTWPGPQPGRSSTGPQVHSPRCGPVPSRPPALVCGCHPAINPSMGIPTAPGPLAHRRHLCWVVGKVD